MALLEDEPKHSWRELVFIGIPSFVIAVLISIVTHQYAHVMANRYACMLDSGRDALMAVVDLHGTRVSCPLSSAAGPSWTFVLALASFAFYVRHPRNLFAGAMAFVNASIRLPETLTVFLQLLFHNRTHILVDESNSLSLIHLKDPTLSVVLMCFFTITVFYLTITVVHDTKTVPWKWLVAVILFVALNPLQLLLWKLIGPVLG